MEDSNYKDRWSIFKWYWRPTPSIFSTSMCFLITGVICLIIGIIVLYFSSQIVEYTLRYDEIKDCIATFQKDVPCEITISLSDNFVPPIMVYYQLENFLQNHRRFIKSKSISQLNGSVLSTGDLKIDCDPVVTVKDLGIKTTLSGKRLDDDEPANPCGLMARTVFNDTYTLEQMDGTPIFIDETNISWPSDREHRFAYPENYRDLQWRDVKDEHFMVWMRPAAVPNFRKLWGRINTTMTTGPYKLKIANNFQVESFGGKKSIVLSTANALGGKNNFLGIGYVVIGCLCIVMVGVFYVGNQRYKRLIV